MFANLLIDVSIPTLSLNDTVDRALSIMQTNAIQRIPIVDQENRYLGNVQEEDLLDSEDDNNLVASLLIERLPINFDEHLLNILRNPNFVKDGFLAIVDHDFQYVGVVTHRSVIEFIGKDRAIEMAGGIIVLEIKAIHYSMTEISRIVESNNANVIYSYISNSSNIENLLITIKVNKLDLKEIISSFERYHYQVIAEFNTTSSEEDIQERYDSLMMYLNV
ncbi:MAG TPA: CBS domain-containing protein [Chitinophagales bacterium]|nr:CBS domain-containing protein [Chitinophagales bacterium]